MRPFEEADGKTYIYAIAHGTLVAKTPYLIIANEYGNITQALSDVTVYGYVGIPAEAVASGAIGKFQIGGYCSSVVCASDDYNTGQGCVVKDGGLECTDADYTGAAGQFAVCAQDDEDAATDIDLMLVPERILTTT